MKPRTYALLLAVTLIAVIAVSAAVRNVDQTVVAMEQMVESTEITADPALTIMVSYKPQELEMLAKMVWGEARGCAPEEQVLVIWTAFQQVDAGGDFANYNSLYDVLTKKHNFAGHRESNPVDPKIHALVCVEAAKWKNGEEPPTLEPYAPTAPYYFFNGDGRHNWFREEWR